MGFGAISWRHFFRVELWCLISVATVHSTRDDYVYRVVEREHGNTNDKSAIEAAELAKATSCLAQVCCSSSNWLSRHSIHVLFR